MDSVYLVDLAPLTSETVKGLFTWPEIVDMQNEETIFRIVRSQDHTSFALAQRNCLPVDLLNLGASDIINIDFNRL